MVTQLTMKYSKLSFSVGSDNGAFAAFCESSVIANLDERITATD